MELADYAAQIREFLLSVPEIKGCSLFGSLSEESSDEYSDIDIEIDVSGIDNGMFLTEIPKIFARKYSVIFADYAPSLAPEKYVVSMAISSVNPFMIVDIACAAHPHVDTVTREYLSSLNNLYEHTLKLFVCNLKHHIRGKECFGDIARMHGRVLESQGNADEISMLRAVYKWLEDNAADRYIEYLRSLKRYL